jgi:hypothetical protein
MGFYNEISYTNAAAGQSGLTNFNDTTSRTDKWFAIQVINDAVFTTLTELGADGTADYTTGITYSAGLIIYGQFRTIKLASGAVRAYKEP